MLKPANLSPAAWQMDSSDEAEAMAYLERTFLGRVLVAWGDARWSRTQLLGEIARGHWGLGKASVCELTAGPPARWAGLDDRLCFSPVTEMTVRRACTLSLTHALTHSLTHSLSEQARMLSLLAAETAPGVKHQHRTSTVSNYTTV